MVIGNQLIINNWVDNMLILTSLCDYQLNKFIDARMVLN